MPYLHWIREAEWLLEEETGFLSGLSQQLEWVTVSLATLCWHPFLGLPWRHPIEECCGLCYPLYARTQSCCSLEEDQPLCFTTPSSLWVCPCVICCNLSLPLARSFCRLASATTRLLASSDMLMTFDLTKVIYVFYFLWQQAGKLLLRDVTVRVTHKAKSVDSESRPAATDGAMNVNSLLSLGKYHSSASSKFRVLPIVLSASSSLSALNCDDIRSSCRAV